MVWGLSCCRIEYRFLLFVLLYPPCIAALQTIRKELMQSMGASPVKTYFKMTLPSAATDIFTGIQLAAIMATTACISVEYNAGNTGLGSQIIKYSQYMRTDKSFACIFYVTIIGIFMYALVTIAQKKIVSWKE